MISEHACPGCNSREVAAGFLVPKQPVVLNYRFASPAEAMGVARRNIDLAQCASCGLVYNATFDPAAVTYDQNYDNRQCFSPAFAAYLEELSDDLIARNQLRNGRILEAGCGKGDFLKLICGRAGAEGEGYDTTYEGPECSFDGRVRFHRSYVSAADVRGEFDALICRHVIEHVAGIGAFLRELQTLALAAGDPVVVLETPCFEWIVEHSCFWDVFYEHCNYFSQPCLAHLAHCSGFEVVNHFLVFGGQYQVMELKRGRKTVPTKEPPGILPEASLEEFGNRVLAAREQLEQRLAKAGADRGWAIWGAGAKGVALVNQIQLRPPEFVIDSNPSKQGAVIPGTDVRIKSPEDPAVLAVPVILVANPNYLDEIRSMLMARGFGNTLLIPDENHH
jgi:SAM-dependent methyltransferase